MKEGRSETERMKEEGKKRGREAGGDICQQFVVEFELVSVNTDAVLGEASRDARLLVDSEKRCQRGGTFRVHLDSHKCLNIPYIHGRLILMGRYTDGRWAALGEAGGKQHNITETAPNELKLGEGG